MSNKEWLDDKTNEANRIAEEQAELDAVDRKADENKNNKEASKTTVNALELPDSDMEFFLAYESHIDKMEQESYTDKTSIYNKNPEHYYELVIDEKIAAKLHNGYRYVPVRGNDETAPRPVFGMVVDGHWKVNELTLMYTLLSLYSKIDAQERFKNNQGLEASEKALDKEGIASSRVRLSS